MPHFVPTRPRSLISMVLLASCLCFTSLPAPARAASVVAVDQNNGYAGSVLDKILSVWTPPSIKGNQLLRVRISLNGQGQVVGCTPTRSSGYPALDNSACLAVKAAAPYDTPPYGLPLDVHLAFWTGTPVAVHNLVKAQPAPAAQPAAQPVIQQNVQALPASGSVGSARPAAQAQQEAPAQAPATGLTPQEQHMQMPGTTVAGNTPSTMEDNPQYSKYFSTVRWKLRNAIYIPVETKPGTYSVVVRLQVTPSGNIKSYDVLKSSGDARLDKYVRQGIRRAGSIAAPPAELGDTLDVTLKLIRY